MDVNVLNKYEGLFEKLGILAVVVFFLLVIAGFSDASGIGKIMTLVLLFLVGLASLAGYIIAHSLD